MSQKVVLLVEPSFYGVNYVREAKKLGCYVVAIVSDAKNPAQYGYDGLYDDLLICDIRNKDAIYDVIKSSKYQEIDALISATDYAIANTAYAAEKLGLKYMSHRTGQYVRNKDLARVRFQQCGVPSAKFSIVRSASEAVASANHIGYPVVLKPTNTASSQHVYFIENAEKMTEAFGYIKEFETSYMGFPVRDEYLVEEFLDGPEFSVELFMQNGKVAFGEVTEKITSMLPFFVEKCHVFPTSKLDLEKDLLVFVAWEAVKALGLKNGPAHVEVKYTLDGPKIVEVNGRPGGDNITSDLIPLAYKIDIFSQTIRNLLGEKVEFPVMDRTSAAVGYLCADADGDFLKIANLSILENDPAVVKYCINVKKGDPVRVPHSSDDRLGYVIVTMPTPEEAKKKVIELLDQLIVIVEEYEPAVL